jgi:hypothetical protein
LRRSRSPQYHSWFIGWALIVHGILFAAAGYMPSLWLFAFFTFHLACDCRRRICRAGNDFSKSLPITFAAHLDFDRGAELTIFGLSSYAASLAIYEISPQFFDRCFRHFIGKRGRRLVSAAEKIRFRVSISESKLETS